MTAADAFFFPSREETEGIVVLEALASHQDVVVRDIPVYKGWLDTTSASLATDVDGFVAELEKVLNGTIDKTEKGYQVAQTRAIEHVAAELAAAYRQTLEL